MADDRPAADSLRAPPIGKAHAAALEAAVMRGGHLVDNDKPKVFADGYALALAGVSEEEARECVRRDNAGGGVSLAWALFSRWAEDRLAAARAEGRAAQYVILGAGLDTFALRMAGRLRGLTIFEVDAAPMQAWKRWRLASLGMGAPSELRFAAFDFKERSVAEALSEVGYDPKQPTFISWLGATQHLGRETIEKILHWAATHLAGSEAVLSFRAPSGGVESVRRHRASRGRSTDFTPAEMSQVLTRAGFGSVEHLTIERANRAYYRGRRNRLPPDLVERVVSARVA